MNDDAQWLEPLQFNGNRINPLRLSNRSTQRYSRLS